MGWKVIPPTDANPLVTARFEGHLTAEEGQESAAAFRAAFHDAPLDVAWDVSRMSGFDGGARSAWGEVVWPLRGQIRHLKIIGAKGMVRVGATFLALLLRRPYEFVNAPDPSGEERAS